MPYVIAPREIDRVVLVGCGGTGGFVAEGLCRLLPKNIELAFVDYDRVEPHNLLRQSFFRDDLDKFKSEVLANRLARAFGREISYTVLPFGRFLESQHRTGNLIIGCVDNASARQSIAEAFVSYVRGWWIDAGNEFNSGQVLVGNLGEKACFDNIMDAERELCYALPLPTVQRPDLLTSVPEQASGDVDCAEAIELGDQSAIINQMMAALILEFVRKLLTGQLHWMQAYVDMDVGQITPTEIEPKRVARMVNSKVNQVLIKPGGNHKFCPNCGSIHYNT